MSGKNMINTKIIALIIGLFSILFLIYSNMSSTPKIDKTCDGIPSDIVKAKDKNESCAQIRKDIIFAYKVFKKQGKPNPLYGTTSDDW